MEILKVNGQPDFLRVDLMNNSILEIKDFVEAEGLRHLSLNVYAGCASDKLSELSAINGIKGIEIVDDKFDPDLLYAFKELEYLYCSGLPTNNFDLKQLPNLKYLNIQDDKRVRDISGLKKLEHLVLRKLKDVSKISQLETLSSLEIIDSKIQTLVELIWVSALTSLSLTKCPKLDSIFGIDTHPNLRSFEIENCMSINLLQEIVPCNKLESLKLVSSGSLENLDFINQMTNLRFFACWDTNIESGDLSPLVNLEYAAFNEKRHYNAKSINGKAVLI